jgi:epoxyqueuosine reductase
VEETDKIAQAALGLGFAAVGFTTIEPFQRGALAHSEWIAAGMHGTMAYMARPRADPRSLLEEARSMIVVALPYAPPKPAGGGGYVAAYARGPDYHRVLRQRLGALAEACAEIVGRPVLARPCADSAPLLEHEAAARAGVGFIAKNTLTIVRGVGSYTVLGELLLDTPLAPSAPSKPACGQCSACITACPTGAFRGPRVLDARRCISYLTIEHRGDIPEDLRPLLGDHVFGCDICQRVCPFNARPAPGDPALVEASFQAPDLTALLHMRKGSYKRWVRGTARARASRVQLARNAAVAMGNSEDPRYVATLTQAVQGHASAMVRRHAQWALERLSQV